MNALRENARAGGIALGSTLAFFCTLPLGEVSPWPGTPWLSVAKLGFMALLAGLGLAWVRGWRPRHFPALYLALGVLVAGAATAAAFSPDPGLGLVYAVRVLSLAALCVITAWVAAEGQNLAWMAGVLLAVAALLSCLGIYQTLSGRTIGDLGVYGYFGRLIDLSASPEGGATGIARASATFDHPNLFGTFLVGVIPLALVLTEALKRKRPFPGFTTALVLCGTALLYTFSRSAWLGAGAALLVLLLRSRVRRGTALVAAIAGLLAGIALLPPAGRSVLLGRTGGVQRYDRGRLYSYRAALRMAAHHPVCGVGPGRFHVAYPDYAGPDEQYRQNPLHHMDAHNMFLDVGAEGGLLVFLPFVGVLLLVAGRAARRVAALGSSDGQEDAGRLWLVAAAAALGGVLVQGLFHSVEYEKILWVLVGLCTAANRDIAPKAQQPG